MIGDRWASKMTPVRMPVARGFAVAPDPLTVARKACSKAIDAVERCLLEVDRVRDEQGAA